MYEWLNNNWPYILVSIYTKQVFYFYILFFKFDNNGRVNLYTEYLNWKYQ